MGCYDNFEDTQIKVGECLMRQFKVGDRVDSNEFPDGAYIAYEGIIIIKQGIFITKIDKIYNKWGIELSIDEILEPHNPVGKINLQEKPYLLM